jgi:glycogen phosphorylase
VRPIHTFSVIPSLPPPIEALRELAYNLRWSWSHDTIELFRRLDRDLWESSGHNPVRLLGTIDQIKLESAALDDAFLAHLERVRGDLEEYLGSETTWFTKHRPPDVAPPLIAYFSAEFGLTECLSIFAGGLGILAGDHLKSASDLGLPLVGVGLLYQQGYFRQYLNQSGWQQEASAENDFHNLPVTPACDAAGKQIVVQVEFPNGPVFAQVWRVQVGRVPLYLLDTNIAANTRPEDRDITDQLYGGDRELRIRQEIVLGIGGYRALEALGLTPTVFHMNEGHSAFLGLERVRRLMESRRLSFAEARELASASLVFTTHTPVEAGHDYFSPEQMDRYFGNYSRFLGIAREQFLGLGRRSLSDPGDFCMTVLALRLAARANGVSKLHGEVSRHMWQSLWPEVPVEEVPVTSITNGVHFRSWISLEMNQLYDRYLGPSWREEASDGDVWSRAQSIPAEELWRTHERRRDRLVSWARRRVHDQRMRRSAPQAEIDAALEILDPDALTIGFARRFATYKRATLILRDLPRLRRILGDPARPVQFIFAGKAHPRDDAGKELIRQIVQIARDPTLGRHIVFLEDYDMAVARYLVQGVDVWLNTPLRPMEASGTSGMKATANAVLNLSVPDGWWDEVWKKPENPKTMGWAIGKGEAYTDPAYQDQVEAEALYDLIERDVIPTFYDRGPDRLPRRWIERMKASVGHICHFVNTHRMVGEYAERFYLKAHQQFLALEGGNCERARMLAGWLERVRREWPRVAVEAVAAQDGRSMPVGSQLQVKARARLGALTPADVALDLCVGRLNPAGEIVDSQTIPMRPAAVQAQGDSVVFEAAAPCLASGLHGYTIRARPSHPDLAVAFLPGMIVWAGSIAAQPVPAWSTS